MDSMTKIRFIRILQMVILCLTLVSNNARCDDKEALKITFKYPLPEEDNEGMEYLNSLLLFFNGSNKLISQERISCQKPFFAKEIPEGAQTIRVIPNPQKLKFFSAASEAPILISSERNEYELSLSLSPPIEVNFIVKYSDGKPVANRHVSVFDVTYGKTKALLTMSTDVTGKLSFYGYQGQRYQLGAFIPAPVQTMEETSQPYEIKDSKDANAFEWKLSKWNTMEISFYNINDGKKSLFTDLERINIMSDYSGASFPVTEGKLVLNLDAPQFIKAKSLSVRKTGQKELENFRIVEGKHFPRTAKEHAVVFSNDLENKIKMLRIAARDAKSQSIIQSSIIFQKSNNEGYVSSSKEYHEISDRKANLFVYAEGYKIHQLNEADVSLLSGDRLVDMKPASTFTIQIKPYDKEKPILAALTYSDIPELRPIPITVPGNGNRFSITCDPTWRPVLVAIQENTAASVISLEMLSSSEPIDMTISKGTTLSGLVQRNTLQHFDDQKKPFSLIFKHTQYKGIIAGGTKISSEGKWSVQLQPGEYIPILVQEMKGFVLSKPITVTNEKEYFDIGTLEKENVILLPLKDLLFNENSCDK